MGEDKKKYQIYTSPKGVAKWANLNTPQTQIGRGVNAKPVDPNYSVTLLFDSNDPAYGAFQETIIKLHAAALQEAKDADKKKKFKDEGLGSIFGEDTNKDGEPTGKVYAKFKHKAQGTRKDKSVWTYKPALFDASGKPLATGVVVYGGSVLKVAYGIKHTPMPTGAFYTSLQLQAVQVLELKSEYVKEASSYGFTSEEGYTGEGEENAFGEQSANVTDGGADASQSSDF